MLTQLSHQCAVTYWFHIFCIETLWNTQHPFYFQLKTSQQYLFGKRDSTKQGESLAKIIDMVRWKYSLNASTNNYEYEYLKTGADE